MHIRIAFEIYSITMTFQLNISNFFFMEHTFARNSSLFRIKFLNVTHRHCLRTVQSHSRISLQCNLGWRRERKNAVVCNDAWCITTILIDFLLLWPLFLFSKNKTKPSIQQPAAAPSEMILGFNYVRCAVCTHQSVLVIKRNDILPYVLHILKLVNCIKCAVCSYSRCLCRARACVRGPT